MDTKSMVSDAIWRIVSGNIVTMDIDVPEAEAMLIAPSGRIEALGRRDAVKELAPAQAQEEVLEGAIVPGFIDSHFYLQRAGIKLLDLFPDSDPSGEEFRKVLLDTAGDPDWSGGEITIETRRHGLRRVQRYLHEVGITGVSDPWSTQDTILAYQMARAADELTLRVTAMPYIEELRDRLVSTDDALTRIGGLGLSTGFGDETLSIGAFKVYVDGEGRRQQALRELPWPGTGEHGIQAIDFDDIVKVAEFCAERNWSLALHAIGGKAMRIAIDALEVAARRKPSLRSSRFRLIHAYLEPSEETMRKAAELGVILSSQPAIQWANGAWLHELLPSTGAQANPLRSWLDAGVRVVIGSDGPYFPFEPCKLMWFARTRHVSGSAEPIGAEQALTPQEALRSITIDAAYMAGVEDIRGSLSEGKLADWVQLSAHPLESSDHELRELRVLRTVVGGRTVYTAP